jgi:hypothetical protein
MPVVLEYLPASHATHTSAESFSGDTVVLYLPATQSSHADVLPGEYVPATQSTQEVLEF